MDAKTFHLPDMPEVDIPNPTTRTIENTRHAYTKPIPSYRQGYKYATTIRILKRTRQTHQSLIPGKSLSKNFQKHNSTHYLQFMQLSHHHNRLTQHHYSLYIANWQRIILPIPLNHYLYHDNFFVTIELRTVTHCNKLLLFHDFISLFGGCISVPNLRWPSF